MMKLRPSTDATCPRCLGHVDRVHRHFTDRCLSLFVPVARYRCSAAACAWEGLFSTPPGRTHTNTRAHYSDTEGYRPRVVLEPSRPAPRPTTAPRAAR